MRERILILSAGVGAGHNVAAAAIKQAALARDDVDEVLVLDVLQQSSTLYRDLLGKGYFALVDNAPWLVDWGYDVSDKPVKSPCPSHCGRLIVSRRASTPTARPIGPPSSLPISPSTLKSTPYVREMPWRLLSASSAWYIAGELRFAFSPMRQNDLGR